MVFLTCPTCGGGGYVQSQLCARCRGFGEVMGPPRPVLAKMTQRRQMLRFLHVEVVPSRDGRPAESSA